MASDEWINKFMGLGELLARVPAVQQAGAPREGEDSASTLAHALADIDGEFRAYVDEHLPRLLAATTPGEAEEALWDVRESLRHVAYHLVDSPYLRTLVTDRLDEALEEEAR